MKEGGETSVLPAGTVERIERERVVAAFCLMMSEHGHLVLL